LIIDYGLARVEIAPVNEEAIDATRASFVPAFTGLITANPGRVFSEPGDCVRSDGRDPVNAQWPGDRGLSDLVGKRPSEPYLIRVP
jgi:hypothetical protein